MCAAWGGGEAGNIHGFKGRASYRSGCLAGARIGVDDPTMASGGPPFQRWFGPYCATNCPGNDAVRRPKLTVARKPRLKPLGELLAGRI